MKEVKIYTSSHCPYCTQAKNFFDNKKIPYQAINIEEDMQSFQEITKKTNMRTVPQIFIGDHFVGGYSELAALKPEEFDKLIN